MKLNIIGFLSLILVVISLLLPLWSVSNSIVFYPPFYRVLKFDYYTFSWEAMTLGVDENLAVYDSGSWTLLSILDWDLFKTDFLLTMAYTFSILALSFGVISIITGKWSKQITKMYLLTAFMLTFAVLIQTWFFAQKGVTSLGMYDVDIGIFETKQIVAEEYIGVTSTYPNIGFYLTVASIVSALIAWRYPKWSSLPVGGNRVCMARLTNWLRVSEREKLTILFLSSLLMSYSLIFLTLFVL